MIEVISIILGIIGAISTLYYFKEKFCPFRKISWKFAEKAASKIKEEMVRDNFIPSIIIGIGRGGAIMGALISGCLGHRPLLVIDRQYKWEKGDRFEDMIFPVEIPPKFLDKVLIISGEVHTGNTMKLYVEHFKNLGAKEIKKATLFYEKGATIAVDYKGMESERKNILMPWQFSKNYIRADRYPPASKSANSNEK